MKRFKLTLCVTLLFSLLTLIAFSDTSNAITIELKVEDGNISNTSTQHKTESLDRRKNYVFTVNLSISDEDFENVIKVSMKPIFSTKTTDIPDALKTIFLAPNSQVHPIVATKDKKVLKLKTYTFPAVAIKGDYTTIEVTVEMKDSKNNLVQTIDFGNRNYIKWFSFTTGFFGNSLVNRDFAFSTDGTNIIKEKSKKYDLAIGALGNINYTVCPGFKTGISLGAALSPMDSKTRYLAGFNFTFGRRNEFAISGGWAFAKITALSNSISTNGVDYDIPLSNIATTTNSTVTTTSAAGVVSTTQTVTNTSVSNTFKSVPTYNKWEQGGFIGITYSIIKSK